MRVVCGKLRYVILPALCLLLSSCVQAKPVIMPTCPAPQEWKKTDTDALALELKVCPPGPAVTDALIEWERLRREARLCQAQINGNQP